MCMMDKISPEDTGIENKGMSLPDGFSGKWFVLFTHPADIRFLNKGE